MGERHVFDIDGVVINNDILIRYIRQYYPTFTPTDFVTYHIGTALQRSGFIERATDFNDVLFFNTHGQEIFTKSPLTQGFKGYYNSLVEKGDDVHFLTARPIEASGLTFEYFQANGIATNQVYHVGSPEGKMEVMKRIRPHYFYEDNLDQFRISDGLYQRGVLIDYPYNRHNNLHQNVVRVADFNELARIMNNLKAVRAQ